MNAWCLDNPATFITSRICDALPAILHHLSVITCISHSSPHFFGLSKSLRCLKWERHLASHAADEASEKLQSMPLRHLDPILDNLNEKTEKTLCKQRLKTKAIQRPEKENVSGSAQDQIPIKSTSLEYNESPSWWWLRSRSVQKSAKDLTTCARLNLALVPTYP